MKGAERSKHSAVESTRVQRLESMRRCCRGLDFGAIAQPHAATVENRGRERSAQLKVQQAVESRLAIAGPNYRIWAAYRQGSRYFHIVNKSYCLVNSTFAQVSKTPFFRQRGIASRIFRGLVFGLFGEAATKFLPCSHYASNFSEVHRASSTSGV